MRKEVKKKKARILTDLKQSLQEALEYERGKKGSLRVTELPPPPKPLSPSDIRALRTRSDITTIKSGSWF